MTKLEEKEKLIEILHDLPEDSYLFNILTRARLDIERAIDQDFIFITLAEMVQGQQNHMADIKQLQAQIAKLKSEISDLTCSKNALQNGLKDMANTADRLTNILRSYYEFTRR